MKRRIRPIGLIIIILALFLEVTFIGCGGSSNSYDDFVTPHEDKSVTYTTSGGYSSNRGTFSITSKYSDFMAKATEENTLKQNCSIILQEREPQTNESKLFGGVATRIYSLVASYNESGYKRVQRIEQANRPIEITISHAFPVNTKSFYLASRASKDADWQYSKLENDYTKSNQVAAARMSGGSSANFTFNFTIYSLGQEFTIFGSSDEFTTLQDVIDNLSITKMDYSTDLPYLDLKFNDDNEMVYKTDLIINTFLTANSWNFNHNTVKTVITFLSDSNRTINSLRVVGNSTQYANQTVSTERIGAGDKYVHTITFDDYIAPETSGQTATYSFTLKLTDVPLSEFPANFTIKSIVKDRADITYATEAGLSRDMVLSYLKPVSPSQNAVDVEKDSTLTMKYIGHDVASISVEYICDGATSSVIMPGLLVKNTTDNTITFTPEENWPEGKSITASATAYCCEAHNPNGIRVATFTFTTAVASEPIIPDPVPAPVTVSMIVPSPTTDVDVNTQITLQFSDAIKWVNAYHTIPKLYKGDITVPITVPDFDEGAGTITFQPTEALAYNASYTLVFQYLYDSFMKKEIATTTFDFSTSDGIHSQATISDVGNLTVGSSFTTSPTFTIDFGKDICIDGNINEGKLTQALNSVKVYNASDTLIKPDQPKYVWVASYSKMMLYFNYPLEENASYTIKMGTGITDYEGLTITPFEPYTFSTLPMITCEMTTPNLTVDVARDTSVVIQFSDQIDWNTSLSNGVNIFAGKAEINCTKSYNATAKTLTLTPRNPLNYNASYTVLVAPGMKDPTTGQQIASGSFRFETELVAEINDLYNEPIISPQNLDFGYKVYFGQKINNHLVAQSCLHLKKGDVEIAYSSIEWMRDATHPDVLRIRFQTLEPATTYTISMDPVTTADGRVMHPFDPITFYTVNDITTLVTTPATKTNVEPTTQIVFTFSEDINWSGSDDDKRLFSLTRGYFDISDTIQSFTYATAAKTITIDPGTLLYNASYTIKLAEGLTNRNTLQKVASATFTFTTKDTNHIIATAKLADASNVDGQAILIPTISIDYKNPVKNISLAEAALEFYCEGNLMTGYRRQWSRDLTKLDVYWTATLLPETNYSLKMVNSIQDSEGRIIDPFAPVNFKTMPNIKATLVEPTTLDATIDSSIVLKFSNSISWNEADDAGKLLLKIANKQVVINSFTYNDAAKTLTMTHDEPFIHNTVYTLKILDDLVNDTTRQEVATDTFTFTTDNGTQDKATILLNDETKAEDGNAYLMPVFTVDFKKMVLSSSLDTAKNAIKLYRGGTEITALKKTWKSDYRELEIAVTIPLEHDTLYRFTMDEGAKNFEGTYITPFDNLEFTTMDNISVSLKSPITTTNVALATPIILEFSNSVSWSNYYESYITFRTGSKNLLISDFRYEENTANGSYTLTITPAEPLLYDTSYSIIVAAGIKNNETNQLTTSANFDFKTDQGTAVPATLIRDPADEVDDLYVVAPTFIVDFGAKVLNGPTATASIRLYKSNNVEYKDISKTWMTTDKQKLKITAVRLPANTTYTLKMMSGVQDKEGNPITPFAEFTFTTTDNGNGSENNPYHIYTPAQLDAIRNDLTVSYILQRDIDISPDFYTSNFNTIASGWIPLGDKKESFTGTFDGNNHTITGLMIKRPNKDSVGLFGLIAESTIKNLHITNGTVNGQDSCGSIVGYSYLSTINNCANDNVTINGDTYVGGICGSIYSTTVTNCRNNASVVCNSERGGGITGWTKDYSRISACLNQGSVSTTIGSHIGGIAGYNNGTLENCLNTGSVSGNQYVGGICGSNNVSGKLDRCIATGNFSVSNLGAELVGGICGYNDSTANVYNCVITNSTAINGIVCSMDRETVYNYEDGSDKNKNHFYGSISELNNALCTGANWSNGEVWSSLYWTLQSGAIPYLKNMP